MKIFTKIVNAFRAAPQHEWQVIQRHQRIRAFTNIIERLTAYKGGRTFAVDTTHLKNDPPCIVVTERWHDDRLVFAQKVANLTEWNGRRVEITYFNNQLTYFIY